jgi:hypothetical protein
VDPVAGYSVSTRPMLRSEKSGRKPRTQLSKDAKLELKAGVLVLVISARLGGIKFFHTGMLEVLEKV